VVLDFHRRISCGAGIVFVVVTSCRMVRSGAVGVETRYSLYGLRFESLWW